MLVKFTDEKQMAPLTVQCNTDGKAVFSNVRENLARGYTKFREVPANNRPILICGSGPSLADTLENIRAMQKRGAFVLALNGVGKYLCENGIPPDALAMVDPRSDNVDFAQEKWADEAWLASQCHPDVTAQCESVGMRVVLWHAGAPEMQNHIPAKDSLRMGGGYTIGLCAISCAFVAGFREIHLFGYDSSHRAGTGHAFKQDRNANDELMTATVDGEQFECSVTMAAQASLFLEFIKNPMNEGAEIHAHGTGLIPTMWRNEMKRKALRVLTACYDLGVSPPTYDVMSFLFEAEKHRIANNYDVLDISFQPGPMHGFRADDLPPDVATRQGMLWRVCVGLARLLPSVRNIEVLGERVSKAGSVFPDGWAHDKPVSRYGVQYQRGGAAIFRASDYARKWASRYSSRYATITLRKASHWPERNSNMHAWMEVAAQLSAQGIKPIFVPDSENPLASGYTDCIEAAYDVDLRAALYEGAVINLGVSNGPIWLLPFLTAKYLIFNMGDGSTHTSSAEFLLANGVTNDPFLFGGDGRVIWEADTTDTIMRELKLALGEIDERAA